jgi:prepilin-type N-terminal cleavage/methylation domain-containing protein
MGHSARRGFTLFELLLVLGVLALVVGLTWPSLERLHAHHRHKQAAEMLAVRLSSGRVRAIESGMIYQFRYEPGGRRFLLVPYDPEAPSEVVEVTGTPRARRTAGMLPETCRFEGADSFNDQGTAIPDEWLEGLPDAGDYQGGLWSAPAMFHPDGTATPFEVIVRGQKNNEQLKLSLRGLTGAVKISSVEGG